MEETTLDVVGRCSASGADWPANGGGGTQSRVCCGHEGGVFHVGCVIVVAW